MDLLLIVMCICVLVVALYILEFFLQLLKAAWCSYKKEEYEWTFGTDFVKNKSWKEILLTVLSAAVGVFGIFYCTIDSVRNEYEPEYGDYCDKCNSAIIKGYEITGFSTFYNDSVLCPYCANREILAQAKEKDAAYDEIEANGLYLTDDGYMVVEQTMCEWCGCWAPFNLYDENGTRICIDCITEALQNDKVARAIRNYVEYG